MQSLAESDLESFIMLNKQFLNIGKALYLEGIGTLVKAKEGSLEFTPGEMVTERLEEPSPEHRKQSVFTDDRHYSSSQPADMRKWLLGAAAILTLAIIVWGGWRLSQRTEDNENAAGIARPADSLTTITDTTLLSAGDSLRPKQDTASLAPGSSVQPAGAVSTIANGQEASWKFVIEQTASKNRALKRYNQLKEIGKPIMMETQDSTRFKLYFVLPATIADTAKISDSLRRFYLSRRVFAERN